MATKITGIVYNDLNHNGQHDPGEPGIANVSVTLLRMFNGKCEQTTTNATGNYSFSVKSKGIYRVYETVTPANACPPTVFTQPPGFNHSNGPRVLTVSVVCDDDEDGDRQDSGNCVIIHQDFSHDALNTPLTCTDALIQFVNTPTEWFDIDVITGASDFRGLLDPAHNVNAIGYNILDNFLYGYDQAANHIVRINANRELMQLQPNPTGLPALAFNVGSFDLAGHLYLMVNDTARFYTIDLRPNSATFLKLVDPANNFQEQTANFGTALSTTLNVSDWGFSPVDGFLYGVRSAGNTGQIMRVNPATGAVTALSTSMPTLDPAGHSWGAVAIDAAGTLFAIYNGDGSVFRFSIADNTANGVRISTTFPTSFNDAAMCPTAVIPLIADIGVVKTASPNPVDPGNTLTYTIAVTNGGPDSAPNVILADTIPAELIDPMYSLDGGQFLPWPTTLNVGTIAPGNSRTVIIKGTVADTVAGTITNTAAVKSDAFDPHPDNNTSTAVTDVETETCVARCQVISDLIESVALQEAALAHILNAEGEKLQRIIADADASLAQLLQANRSIQSMLSAVALLENVLIGKLSLFSGCLCSKSD